MRTIQGQILLPTSAPRTTAAHVYIELRDTSVADAPSEVIAETVLKDVKLAPGARIPFSLLAPEADESRSLSLRVHVSLSGSTRAQEGDLLTTANYDVPNKGDASVQVSVKEI